MGKYTNTCSLSLPSDLINSQGSKITIIVANLFNSFFGTSAICEQVNVENRKYLLMLNEFNAQAITKIDRRKYALFIHRRASLIVHASLKPKRFIVDKNLEIVGA